MRTRDPGNTPFQGLSQGSREVRGEMEKKELPSQSFLWPSAHSFPCQALLNGEGTEPLPDPAPHPMPHGLSIPQPCALPLEPDPRAATTDGSKEDSTPTPVTALLISNKITQRAVLLLWGQARESVMNYPGLGLTGLQPRAPSTIQQLRPLSCWGGNQQLCCHPSLCARPLSHPHLGFQDLFTEMREEKA